MSNIRHRAGIDYKRFLKALRPELADKILGQGIVRAGVLRRQPGTSRQDAEEQAKDEMMVQYGQQAECAAALRRLEKRSPLPDQSAEPDQVVCCSDQAPEIPEDDEGEPPLWSADRDAVTQTSENGGTADTAQDRQGPLLNYTQVSARACPLKM